MRAREKPYKTQPLIERLETRCLLDCTGTALVERTYDGTCNNLAHPEWGSTNMALIRHTPTAYADGISAPVVGSPPRPSPRAISNTVVRQAEDILEPRFLAAMMYAFGQFIDHDLDLTKNATPAEPFNIPVPTCDTYFDPSCTGAKLIYFNRSQTVPGTGTDISNPRQQPNLITAFIDGSVIYGSDAVTAAKLRSYVGGRLKVGPHNMLPLNNSQYFSGCAPGTPCLPMDNDAHRVPDTELFAAGDVRANENVELTSLHTLFVREHNWWAGRIESENPSWTDDQIYQRARHIVAAELQVITYKEWIPAIFGPNALSAWQGYNANTNPGIANEFSTASFRMGHSMLGDDVEFLDNDGEELSEAIPLSEAFFNPPIVTNIGIGPILKYLSSDSSQLIDTRVVNSLRNFLFGQPGQGGFDLASLNIQRGRDHGLADYNTVREAYGLPRVSSFAEITSNLRLQRQLAAMYGNVDNIDLWVGGLAEDHVPGSSTGPLLRSVILDQFQRTRDGDRFWYQNSFTGSLLEELEATTLGTVIARNTEINNLQGNVFFFELSLSGKVFHDINRNGSRDPGEGGLPGRMVALVDEQTWAVVARTTTDSNGRFDFNNLEDGIDLGRYRVRHVAADGWILTTPAPPIVEFTRGAVVADVAFGTDDVSRHWGMHGGTAPSLGSDAVAAPEGSASSAPGRRAESLLDPFQAQETPVETSAAADVAAYPAPTGQTIRFTVAASPFADMEPWVGYVSCNSGKTSRGSPALRI
jgi:hypothetical protein